MIFDEQISYVKDFKNGFNNWIKYFFGIILSVLLLVSGTIKWLFKLLLKKKIVLILFLVLVLLAMLWLIFGK